MFRKITAALLTIVLLLSVFAGCASKSTPTATPETTPEASGSGEETAETPQPTGDALNVVLWHSMGGRNGEAIDALIADYNSSQSTYFIEGQYQGNYDEAITKLRSTTKGTGPDIMQLYDIGTRWMIDSGYSLKMQDFIDKDSFDISDYEENILAYYTLDGELYSMPFNCSSPVIIYNKEALEKAGLDPATAFTTLDVTMASAEKLAADGGVTVGGTLTNYGWVFEQYISMQGQYLLDNDNGRTARATKVMIGENGSGLAVLEKWKTFAAQPYTDTYGKGPAEAKNQFAAGTVGFLFESCSIYTDVAAAAEGSFTVGFAPMPKVNEGDTGGNSVGGGSLWLMDNGDEAKQTGAWDFIKFATQPEQQARWSIGTGYFPIRSSASELDFYKEYTANVNPELMVALGTLRASKPNYAGGVMGVFPKARVIIENEIETMVNGEAVTPQETLDKIVTQIDEEIEMYNKTN